MKPLTAHPRRHSQARWITGMLLSVSVSSVLALPPAELQKRLDQGDKVTLVDVRKPELYAKGHIPGAINIPASVIASKRLPALGEVIVYGEGLGRDTRDASSAVDQLNQKPGIRAVTLDGGFSAWETGRHQTTAPRGMKREEVTYITYDQLKQSGDTLVLVDLRDRTVAGKSRTSAAGSAPLSDLAKAFPGRKIVKEPAVAEAKSAAESGAPVLILIDRNDGTAEETARKLRSDGRTRVAILAGGEEIIAHGGRPGLERVGSGIVVDQTKAGETGRNK